MKPYYEQDGITIYHGDCREILPSLSGDALITDPPFGIDWSRATWSDDIEAYPELMRWLVSEGNRLGGWCFVFQASKNASRFHEWFPSGFRIFAACKNFAQVNRGVWYGWEPVVFWNAGQTNKAHGRINRDYHIGNTRAMFGDGNNHPCPRPLDTVSHIVEIACPTNGMAVDPFCGSGTTLLAAKGTGRRAVGIEIEERYCEIAATRLSQGVLKLEQPA